AHTMAAPSRSREAYSAFQGRSALSTVRSPLKSWMRKTTSGLINPRPLLLDMAPPGMSLDSRSIADLVRLRAAIEHARLLADDLSDHGSRIALVALDGAVEYAMWLTVQSAGLPLNERANFHDTMKTLINHHKGAWEQHGRRGVLQIHTA